MPGQSCIVHTGLAAYKNNQKVILSTLTKYNLQVSTEQNLITGMTVSSIDNKKFKNYNFSINYFSKFTILCSCPRIFLHKDP